LANIKKIEIIIIHILIMQLITVSYNNTRKMSILIITSLPKTVTNIRSGTNKPELRHFSVYTRLLENKKKLHLSIVIPTSQDNSLTINKLKELDVHNPLLIDFIYNCYNNYLVEGNKDTNFTNSNNSIVPYNVTKSKYEDNPEINLLLQKLPYFRQCGLWADDSLTPIFEDTWENVFASANNSYLVLEYIDKHDVIYCLNSQPGHHAKYNSYGGYCFLNNAAIIVRALETNNYRKFAVLDIDYHAGNGTSDIFTRKQNDNVLTISIHANPSLDYPFYESYEEMNTETDINIIFEPNTDINNYITLIDKALTHIVNFTPDCLIIPFGGDTFRDDPDASPTCRCGLEISDYEKISKRIRELYKGKIVICQEGGYNMDNISEIVEGFLQGFLY